MKFVLLTILLLFIAACDKKESKYAVPAQVSGWTARYGDITNCTDFNFGEAHYCITSMPVTLGQTIRIRITVSGDLHATEGSAPASIHLFLWRRGDNLSCTGGPTGFQGYRYWSRQGIQLTPGTHELEVRVDASEWTDCYAQNDAGAFAATVATYWLSDIRSAASSTGTGSRAQGTSTSTASLFRTNELFPTSHRLLCGPYHVCRH